ncbi:hypothetical protein GH789_12605 [Rhizobium pusense]|uniref:helix-turn-helix domain-containing protein n=1 Tax=Agrobacterium pusense TaxID=648995 RepID=UPI00129BC893|nr:helix-turn-helix domain-containing protein [Agrobacterium pusense]MRG66116.1 hypothetical protein [Agrobacterium pusense]
MKVENGFYVIPTLPAELAGMLKDKSDWPAETKADYKKMRAEFTASKAEYFSWVRRDRDCRMNGTAKQVLSVILDCLNFDTGRCDPSHQFIADELGISVRTVERTIPRIVKANWISVRRRGITKTNLYRFEVPKEKVTEILDYVEGLREQRAEERERRRLYGDPTKMADHRQCDPTTMRSNDPTNMADHVPTELADKHLNGTSEGEPLNTVSFSERREISFSYSTDKLGDEENNPLPVPADDAEAESMMDAICDGRVVPLVLRNRLKSMLSGGVLTPRMANNILGPRQEVAA